MIFGRLNGPWTFRQGLLVLLAFILSYAALSAGHFYWVKHTVGFEAYLGDGPRLPPKLLIVSQTIKALTLLGAVWLAALKLRNLPWSAVGFRPCHWGWLIAAALTAVAAQGFGVFLAKNLVSAMPEWASFTASRYAWGDAPFWRMLALIGLTIAITPIAEETFFRGFLFQWMATHHPVWLAMLISSIMFGASHIVPPQMIFGALLSLFLIGLFVGSRSIWPSILCHSVNNALGVGLNLAAAAGLLPAYLTPPAA